MKTFFLGLVLCTGINGFCQSTQQITNPVLAGFYPDPSVCKANGTYYLVNSTFAYFPGITIFKSQNLLDWEQLGHAMDRPAQLDLDGAGVSRGLFAPTIRFNNGVFYIVCTLIDHGGNFLITAKDPAGPWSNPIWIPEVNGIDPSLFFDENGKTYLIYNSVAPDDKPLYDGHRTIRMREFDINTMKVVGAEKILVNGGTDLNKKPVWIEAPHILKKGDFYFLICAEGGTGYNHSEVVFRSSNVDGPYVPYEKNPILTQRHLDPSRKNPITTTGHADFVETDSGEWWAVFLGCRPYESDYYNTGRETFLAPVQWKDNWPTIDPDHVEIQYRYPINVKSSKSKNEFSGNFAFVDKFDQEKLGVRWTFLRTPRENWFSLSERKGFLSLQLRPETCAEKKNPSFIAHRQQHLRGSASTSLSFKPQSNNEKAGLTLFQNENHFYFLCKSVENDDAVVQLYKSKDNDSSMELIAFQKLKTGTDNLQLKIEAKGKTYSFLFSPDGNHWITLQDNVDAKFLSTKTAGGFVGCMFALYATSQGQPSNSKAYFDWFSYQGEDKVYKD